MVWWIFPQAKPYSRVFGDYENTPSNWTVRYLDPSVSEDKRFLDEMTVLSNIAKLVRNAVKQHVVMETALCGYKYRTHSDASTLLFSSGGVWTCVQGWCAWCVLEGGALIASCGWFPWSWFWGCERSETDSPRCDTHHQEGLCSGLQGAG